MDKTDGPTRQEFVAAGIIALSVAVAVAVDLYIAYESLIPR